MDLPKSGARNFFEILMPGVFLLLNLLGTFALLMVALADAGRLVIVREFLANTTMALALILSLGYLLGVVLRLFRTEYLDSWSGWFIGQVKTMWRKAIPCRLLFLGRLRLIRSFKTKRRTEPRKRPGNRRRKDSWITEPFFYNRWMQQNCNKRFDPAVGKFYELYWANRATGNAYENTSFFNFCKALINKVDPGSASEVFEAEAMSRFVAGSCYALCFALVLAPVDAVIVCVFISCRLVILPFSIALVYSLLVMGILWTFRLLRCKEVRTVFDACYLNREYFEGKGSPGPTAEGRNQDGSGMEKPE